MTPYDAINADKMRVPVHLASILRAHDGLVERRAAAATGRSR
jgi:hypothetical protein